MIHADAPVDVAAKAAADLAVTELAAPAEDELPVVEVRVGRLNAAMDQAASLGAAGSKAISGVAALSAAAHSDVLVRDRVGMIDEMIAAVMTGPKTSRSMTVLRFPMT